MRLILLLYPGNLLGEDINLIDTKLILAELAVNAGYFLRELMILEEGIKSLLKFLLSEFLFSFIWKHYSHNVRLGIDLIDLSFCMLDLPKNIILLVLNPINLVLQLQYFSRIHFLKHLLEVLPDLQIS